MDIDRMKAGKEMDAELALNVMGWRWYNPPGFCSVFVSPSSIETSNLHREYLSDKPTRERRYQIGPERADVPVWSTDKSAAHSLLDSWPGGYEIRRYKELHFCRLFDDSGEWASRADTFELAVSRARLKAAADKEAESV